MNLLLTNDDGYEAEGINILFEKLSKNSNLNVYMVAPDGNRSAISHAITMFKRNVIKKQGKNKWSCSGNPADCVLNTIRSSLIPVKIDCVIAGINHGANLGTDIIYSGTCGAAREASIEGIPGIALSLEYSKEGKLFGFEELAEFAEKNLDKLIELCKKAPERSFVNVNMVSSEKHKGVKLCSKLGLRTYADTVGLEPKGDDLETVFHSGTLTSKYEEGTDCKAAEEGYISVSLIASDPVSVQVVDGIHFSL